MDAVDPLFRIGQVRALPGMMYALELVLVKMEKNGFLKIHQLKIVKRNRKKEEKNSIERVNSIRNV